METVIEIVADIISVIAKWLFIGVAYLICSPYFIGRAIYNFRTGKYL